MTEQNSHQPTSSIGANEVLFTVFRHKWKIIFFCLLGIGGAAAAYYLKQPPYTSTAKILVKYVIESKGSDLPIDGEVTRAPEQKGNAIMQSEASILKSADLMKAAVEWIGPAKVLAAYGGGNSEPKATRLLVDNLEVLAGKIGGVMEVSLAHKNPEIAETVLRRLIEEYERKHLAVHQSTKALDSLQVQIEKVRTRLVDLDSQLRAAKTRAGVISLPDAKLDVNSEISALRNQISDSETEIAIREAQLVQIIGTNVPPVAAETSATNDIASPNVSAAQPLIAKLRNLNAYKMMLLGMYAESGRPVQKATANIEQVEAQLRELGIDPATVEMYPTARNEKGSEASAPVFDPAREKMEIASLRVKVQALRTQLDSAVTRARELDNIEGSIEDLQFRRNAAQELLVYFAKNLEKARIDEAIDSGRANNITVIQNPSLAEQDYKDLYKLMAGVFAGCLAAGLLLALSIDFVFDRSVKRSLDLEKAVGLPVFATVPIFGRNGHSKLRLSQRKAKANGIELFNGEIAPWSDSDPMLPYYEAIRDRLVMSYGEDPHKPKIVGVTSCHKGAGVSRLATGLAASLSRDVERSVLLIGLEKDRVAISAFGKGRPANALENGAELGTNDPFVQQDLHSLATTGRNRNGASIVQSFSDLLPKLKVADYDFVIFDLPPVSQTSGTIRLASQLERTILVVEAEETSKDHVNKLKSLLGPSKTQLFAVLNKAQSYGPEALNGH